MEEGQRLMEEADDLALRAEAQVVQEEGLRDDVKHLLARVETFLRASPEPPHDQAWNLLVEGKARDVLDPPSLRAEALLAQAVKLAPHRVEAWNALGRCLWRRGRPLEASYCFRWGLEWNRNKKTLTRLSMAVRVAARGAPDEAKAISESLELAREALGMDVKDSEAWFALANANLSYYFTVDRSETVYERTLKAFRRAEQLAPAKMPFIPDLHYNKGALLKYRIDYGDAYGELSKAVKLDPGLISACEDMKEILNVVSQIAKWVSKKGGIKQHRIKTLSSTLPDDRELHTHLNTPVSGLTLGKNEFEVVVGRVIGQASRHSDTPLILGLVDREQTIFIAAVYFVRDGVIHEGDELAIVKPSLATKSFQPHSDFVFPCILAEHWTHVRLNGNYLRPQDVLSETVKSSAVSL